MTLLIMETKIKKILESSKKVIKDCSLENGAIVAANSSKGYFPKEAKDYRYVWVRDASFACVAADILGIDIQEKFFDWCVRAEGFQNTGVFYEKYFVNGLKALKRFQPDQTGSLLWAIWNHFKGDYEKALRYRDLISKAANGICSKWKIDHFAIVANDLWEERLAFPDLKENWTYSLAACIRGLECANSIIPNKSWSEVANMMRKRLEKHCETYFMRSYGGLCDREIDASTLGLVYPFEVFSPNDKRIISTIREIEQKIVDNGGLHRYEHDKYDGWVYGTIDRRKGAGAWPLLNFWISIYYAKAGNKEKALKYYNWVISRVDRFIPEQIFRNDIQVSVSPLCWSHSMFIIASKELELI
jgi:GH15 family glucan-1,4-alpha-glucosidase